MENLNINKTESTPEVRLNYTSGVMEFKGESYPENTAEFYAPVFEWVRNYLNNSSAALTTVNMEIIYFNSSSSKALMNFFDMMDKASEEGRKIVINWIYDAENENSMEYGEEFKEDLESLEFNLVENND
jgi:SiaC family regulatory phosphoprotein